MELVPNGVCMLCEENTALLTPPCCAPYRKYMQNTFFDQNKKSLKEFEQATADGSVCSLCTHKIVVSHKFKALYEGKSQKRTAFRKTRLACLLCETKDADLVNTDVNPNNFIENVESFMDSSLHPRPYLQCAVCFDCLFYLNIWCEVNSNIMQKISSGEIVDKSGKLSNGYGEALKKIQPKTIIRTPRSFGPTPKKDKENITPESSSGRSEFVDQLPTEMPRWTSTPSTSRAAAANTVSKKKIMRRRSKQEESFLAFLKKSLNNLQSVQQSNSTTWPANIVRDKKMFLNIPYVLISKECDQTTTENEQSDVSEVSFVQSPRRMIKPRSRRFKRAKIPNNNGVQDGLRRSTRLDKPIEVIELSDNEDETRNKRTSANTSNGDTSLKQRFAKFVQKRAAGNKKLNKPSSHKTGIKIRMSNSFLKLPEITEEEDNFVCQFCDKIFNKRCDYKVHELWHDKQEIVVINVVRQDLPTHIAASNFNQDKQKKASQAEINKLLQKYLPDPLSDEDPDFTHTKEIDNIIENLDSLDSQDESTPEKGEKEDSLGDKQEQEDLENKNCEDGHQDSGETNAEVESEEGSAEAESSAEGERLDKGEGESIDKGEGESSAEDEEENDLEIKQTNSETKNDNGIEMETDEMHLDGGPTSTEESESIMEELVDDEEEAPAESNVESATDLDVSLQPVQEHEAANSTVSEDSQDREEQEEAGTEGTEDIEEDCQTENAKSVEKALAAIHGELHESPGIEDDSEELGNDTTSNVKENDDKNHESEELAEASDGENEEISDHSSETSKAENGGENEDRHNEINNHEMNSDDEEMDRQTVSMKRKRRESVFVADDASEQNSTDECITPKPKKVRFAMDFQLPSPPELTQDEPVPVTILFDSAEKDPDELIKQEVIIHEVSYSEDGDENCTETDDY